MTDRFVFIHLPKTAGTFVGATLARIHRRRLRDLRPRAVSVGRLRHVDHLHAPCSRIPEAYRRLPILATIRNPYDWYVSDYEFAEWSKGEANPSYSRTDWSLIRRTYPHFPALSFEEYLHVFGENGFRLDPPGEDGLGAYTKRFAWTFLRDFEATYPQIDDRYIDTNAILDDLFPITFLHTERLNLDLQAALLDLDYPADRVAFVATAPKVLPTKGGRAPHQKWQRYYTPELKRAVRQRDRLLFRLFPEYDD